MYTYFFAYSHVNSAVTAQWPRTRSFQHFESLLHTTTTMSICHDYSFAKNFKLLETHFLSALLLTQPSYTEELFALHYVTDCKSPWELHISF